MRRRSKLYLPALFCAALAFFPGLFAAGGADGKKMLQEADAFVKSGKQKQAVSVWKKLSRQNTPEGEIAAYRLLEAPFLGEKLSVSKQKRQIEVVTEAILTANSDFRKASAYQLLSRWNPSEPSLKASLTLFLKTDDPRCELAASFALGFVEANQNRFREALACFRKALAIYDVLNKKSETGGEMRPIDPILPWTRQEIAEQALEMEKRVRDLSDSKLYEAALAHYKARRFGEAHALFRKIVENFPESEYGEGAEFYGAASRTFLYQPAKNRKFDQKTFEAPIQDYLTRYPEEIGKFRGEAWTILGNSRFENAMCSPELIREAWEEAAAEFLSQENRSRELGDLFFRLGVLAHYRKDYKRAITHYERSVQVLPDDPDTGFPNAVSLLQSSARSKESGVLEEKSIMTRGDTLLNRTIFMTHAALLARKVALARDSAERLLNVGLFPDPSPNLIAFAEYYRVCAYDINAGFDVTENAIFELEKLAEKHAKSVYAPRILFSCATLQYSTAKYSSKGDATIERLLQAYPGSPVQENALLQIAFSRQTKKDYISAERYYRRILSEYPDSAHCERIRTLLPMMRKESDAGAADSGKK